MSSIIAFEKIANPAARGRIMELATRAEVLRGKNHGPFGHANQTALVTEATCLVKELIRSGLPSEARGAANRYKLGPDIKKEACFAVIDEFARNGQCLFHGSGAQKAMAQLKNELNANETDIANAIKAGILHSPAISSGSGKNSIWGKIGPLTDPCQIMNVSFGCMGRGE